jgi:hypothetical protein
LRYERNCCTSGEKCFSAFSPDDILPACSAAADGGSMVAATLFIGTGRVTMDQSQN